MCPHLQAIADRNAGVVTRRDAISCGYRERELKTLTGHRGSWVVVRRGCYAERALWDRPGHEVLWDEKQCEDWLRRAAGGRGISRVVWAEM